MDQKKNETVFYIGQGAGIPFDFNTCIYFSERNRIISKYYYSKITQKL